MRDEINVPMHDMTNQTSASPEQTLRCREAIEADPGVCSRNVKRHEGIEPECVGGFVREPSDSSALGNSISELIEPMLSWSLWYEWMSEYGHPGSPMVVQEPNQRLCGSVCIAAGNDDERPTVDRNTAGRAGLAHKRTALKVDLDITADKCYRPTMVCRPPADPSRRSGGRRN